MISILAILEAQIELFNLNLLMFLKWITTLTMTLLVEKYVKGDNPFSKDTIKDLMQPKKPLMRMDGIIVEMLDNCVLMELSKLSIEKRIFISSVKGNTQLLKKFKIFMLELNSLMKSLYMVTQQKIIILPSSIQILI